MKRFLLVIALLSGNTAGYGQQTEFSVQAGSGLFRFRGTNSVAETGAVFIGVGYLSNPYGRNSGFSYSVTGQVQHIAKSNYIYGIQSGYECLASRVAVTTITGDFTPTSRLPVAGRAILQSQYLNINPFVGKRLGAARFYLDATIGLDAAVSLSSRESAQIMDTNILNMPITDADRAVPDVDLRPRVNLTGYYRAFGLSLGYSHGLTNYADKRFRDKDQIYAQFWRAGITYRLGKRV